MCSTPSVSVDGRPIPRAAVRAAREPAHDDDVHAPLGRRDVPEGAGAELLEFPLPGGHVSKRLFSSFFHVLSLVVVLAFGTLPVSARGTGGLPSRSSHHSTSSRSG